MRQRQIGTKGQLNEVFGTLSQMQCRLASRQSTKENGQAIYRECNDDFTTTQLTTLALAS
jgi:hypothetical protein